MQPNQPPNPAGGGVGGGALPPAPHLRPGQAAVPLPPQHQQQQQQAAAVAAGGAMPPPGSAGGGVPPPGALPIAPAPHLATAGATGAAAQLQPPQRGRAISSSSAASSSAATTGAPGAPAAGQGGVATTAQGGGLSAAALRRQKAESDHEPEEAAVLAYLRKHGLGQAALELQRILHEEKKSEARTSKKARIDGGEVEEDDGDDKGYGGMTPMEIDEARNRNQRTPLNLSTGGGTGYDLDAAPALAMWGDDQDGDVYDDGSPIDLTETVDRDRLRGDLSDEERRGRAEARRFVRAFTALQTWVLSLPDDPANPSIPPPASSKSTSTTAAADSSSTSATPSLSLLPTATPSADGPLADALRVPPTSKPELVGVCFPLLVHTYCELLECGLEKTAASLLATYRGVHEPSHSIDLQDLDKCRTLRDIEQLTVHVAENSDAASKVREARVQLAAAKRKRDEAMSEKSEAEARGGAQYNRNVAATLAKKVTDGDEKILDLERKLAAATEASTRAGGKLSNFPFLKRARALRWQIGLSQGSYGLLYAFLSRREDLVPMGALLQSRCHVHVERRDPLPFAPPCILEDMVGDGKGEEGGGGGKGRGAVVVRWAAPIHPLSRAAEAGEDVETEEGARTILARRERFPFPKFYLDGGGGSGSGREKEDNGRGKDKKDESAEEQERRGVEFNRALLVNGFRRLEALEIKREYEVGMRRPSPTPTNHHKVATTVEDGAGGRRRDFADPLSPSILLGTLCSAASSGSGGGSIVSSAAAGSPPWEESGVGITCAKLCPPDGRRVASGCDDAAVRIWSIDGSLGGIKGGNKGSRDNDTDAAAGHAALGESAMVLLGHKNGFPVFDVDWNRDGRTLFSAGGDGAVRLWDTAAVGPYGRLSKVVERSTYHAGGTSSSKAGGGASPSSALTAASTSLSVPWSRSEPLVEVNGAALAVYRGHTASTPLWSVSVAPSGYYFASSGSDSTARIWTTDRPTPVRILSGHFSPAVNCVTWHPNCNYVVTGSDDKTVRMWDIQTGRCVRLLSGCALGVNIVRVCPSGRYAAGADYSGIVSIWDLGSGRKVNELRPPPAPSSVSDFAPATSLNASGNNGNSVGGIATGMIHAMSYSACGTALATGGEDCSVRIWDVRGIGSHMSNPEYAASQGWGMGSVPSSVTPPDRAPLGERHRPGTRVPVRTFRTRRTIIYDLQYTKRNLLLSVGNFASTASSSATPVAD